MGAGTRGDAALQLTGQLMNPLLKPQEKRAMRLGTADVGTCGNVTAGSDQVPPLT